MSSDHAQRTRKARLRGLNTAPGTLINNPSSPKSSIQVIAYDNSQLIEADNVDLNEVAGYIEAWPVVWVNVNGLGDLNTIERLGVIFGLHRLALEDITHLNQRPKMDRYDDHLYLIVRMMETDLPVRTEQLSIFMGEGYVLTFLEDPGDCLDGLRRRIRAGHGRIRGMSADYLTYSIIDTIVDNYFICLDALSDQAEHLEDEILERPHPRSVARIHARRRDLLAIRHAVAPLREALNAMIRDEHKLLSDTTRLHLRDCEDHVFQILEIMESHREMLNGMLDVYLSSLSNRMNEVMRTLTLISTIFIPLTFIAGVYGMNFDPDSSPLNMPELHAYLGYPIIMALMAVITVFQIYLFYKKGWLHVPWRRRGPSSPAGGKHSEHR